MKLRVYFSLIYSLLFHLPPKEKEDVTSYVSELVPFFCAVFQIDEGNRMLQVYLQEKDNPIKPWTKVFIFLLSFSF